MRVGIYLQNHSKHSEGLIVRTGSHKHIENTIGKKVNVPSEPGDVIFWYLTTSHSGAAKLLKFSDYVLGDDGSASFEALLYYRMQRFFPFLIRKAEMDRMAMFLTYAIEDQHLERYLRYLKTRKYAVELFKKSPHPAETIAKINPALLCVKSMYEEVKEIELDKVGAEYTQL